MKLPDWLPRAKTLADTLWGVACMIAIPSLFTIASVWYFAPAMGATVETKELPLLHARSGERTRILSNIGVKIPSDRLTYRFALVDSKGRNVYEWPLNACLDEAPPDFSDITVKLPNVVGNYQLVANVTYKINPIKNNDIQVRVAKLSIGN